MAGATRKLSRSERNEETRRRLFSAAAKVVGRYGYAEASISRITTEADLAQGTFYNYFATRQDLLDQLLPTLGEEMLAFIEARVPRAASAAARDIARCEAFFDFLKVCPEYLRILNEAEFFAPTAFEAVMAMIARGYLRVLQRARRRGALVNYTDAELEVIVQTLLGARAYLSRRYASDQDGGRAAPAYILTAYAKLVTEGLFLRDPD